jgi:hypothetical protein
MKKTQTWSTQLKKTLTLTLIIVAVLGLATTTVVMMTGNKIAKLVPEDFSQLWQSGSQLVGSGRKTLDSGQGPTAKQNRNLEPEVAKQLLPPSESDQPLKPADGSISHEAEIGLPGPIPPRFEPGFAPEVQERLYQQSAYYQLLVNDAASYLTQAKTTLQNLDGIILSSGLNTEAQHDYQYAHLVAKIPEKHFTQARQQITANVKQVVSERISSQDKTGRKANLDNQLKTLQEQKIDKQIELETAKTELEKKQLKLEITRLEQQISNIKNQQKNLANEVRYATISLTAADNQRYFQANDYRPTLVEQAKLAWQSLSDLFYLLGYLLIWFLVYSLLWLPLVLLLTVVVRLIRGAKQDKSAKQQVEQQQSNAKQQAKKPTGQAKKTDDNKKKGNNEVPPANSEVSPTNSKTPQQPQPHPDSNGEQQVYSQED